MNDAIILQADRGSGAVLETGEDGEESWIRRLPPSSPYVLPEQRVLRVPVPALAKTRAVFAPYARPGYRVEACCFWYGAYDEETGCGCVEAVVVPRQENHWGHYHVTADAMAEVSAATSPLGWRNLSQVHTHPGVGVEHSRYDDEHANSRKALSIVLPHYGRIPRRWPDGVGVHEFQGGYWHLLTPGDAARRVVVVRTSVRDRHPVQVVDLR